jgi:hypothetical protein
MPESVAESITVLSAASSPEEISAAVDQIAESLETLSSEQLDEIALVISNAKPEVKKKFESEINIFGGGLDKYVPTGSKIPVGERRTLVIIGAVMAAMPVLTLSKK